MAFNLRLPADFRRARWKVKIRNKETREPPHLTIIRGTQAWRINLRTAEFMDEEPDPSVVPNEVVDFIKEEQTWQRLCSNWDAMYPTKPVFGRDEDQE